MEVNSIGRNSLETVIKINFYYVSCAAVDKAVLISFSINRIVLSSLIP